MRIAVAWPKPRKIRWTHGRTRSAEFPDLSDGLLFLEQEGFEVSLEDSLGLPFNPLVNVHEFYSGLDPVRAGRIAMRVRQYDAVLCVGDSTAFAFVLLRRALGLRVPIVLIDPALSDGYPRRKRLQDYVLPRVDHVVVYGRSQIDYLRREYGTRVSATCLYHRADTDFYRPGDLSTPTETPFIFSIGNDVSRDFNTLARAAAMCTSRPGFHCSFVVQTTLPVVDSKGVLDIRRDPISYVRLRELYARAAVVVIPLVDMRHAGGINTLLEAMAMGRPVVISRSAGILDYISHGSTALIVPPGDPDALSGAIQALIASPTEAERLGQAARRFVVQQCDNRLYAKVLADLVRDVITATTSRAH